MGKFQTAWLIKIVFLGEIEIAVGRALNLGLGSWTLAQVMLFWAYGFLFNMVQLFSVCLILSYY